jgi:hypothetical protein
MATGVSVTGATAAWADRSGVGGTTVAIADSIVGEGIWLGVGRAAAIPDVPAAAVAPLRVVSSELHAVRARMTQLTNQILLIVCLVAIVLSSPSQLTATVE